MDRRNIDHSLKKMLKLKDTIESLRESQEEKLKEAEAMRIEVEVIESEAEQERLNSKNALRKQQEYIHQRIAPLRQAEISRIKGRISMMENSIARRESDDPMIQVQQREIENLLQWLDPEIEISMDRSSCKHVHRTWTGDVIPLLDAEISRLRRSVTALGFQVEHHTKASLLRMREAASLQAKHEKALNMANSYDGLIDHLYDKLLALSSKIPAPFQHLYTSKKETTHKMADDGREIDENVEIQKIKILLNNLGQLEAVEGCNLISLSLPRGYDISQAIEMLIDECTNTESNVDVKSIGEAILNLEDHPEVPANGLLLFIGTTVTNDGKERTVALEYTLFKPVETYFFHRGNKFHTEALRGFLESVDSFGIILMDGSRTRFVVLSGNIPRELANFTGGPKEMRKDYVTKMAEVAEELFINPSTALPNVSGLILAGCDGLPTELGNNERFDPRLKEAILKKVAISHVGEDGFHQAIDFSSEILSNVKLIQERKVLISYFKKINDDSGYTIGVKDTVIALQMGAVKILILYEDLTTRRLTLRDIITSQQIIKYVSKEEEQHANGKFLDPVSNHGLEVIWSNSLLEWLIQDYQRFGCSFEFVSKNSREGNQFCVASEGLGAILHDEFDMHYLDDADADGEEEQPADDEDDGDLLFDL